MTRNVFFKSIAALEEAHIPYRQKGQHMNHGTRRAGRVGTLGENTRYSVLYQIFVKKKIWTKPAMSFVAS